MWLLDNLILYIGLTLYFYWMGLEAKQRKESSLKKATDSSGRRDAAFNLKKNAIKGTENQNSWKLKDDLRNKIVYSRNGRKS